MHISEGDERVLFSVKGNRFYLKSLPAEFFRVFFSFFERSEPEGVGVGSDWVEHVLGMGKGAPAVVSADTHLPVIHVEGG